MTDVRRATVVDLGRTRYEPVFRAMRDYTDARNASSEDQIWLTEHEPVFTQGQAGKAEHLLMPGDIEVVQSDRGGQVTYHGPGQIVVYVLLDLRRRGLGIKSLVHLLEDAVIGLLASYHIDAQARPEAPGVYVAGAKVAALGLRVRRGCSYHGVALNVAMDLEPFRRIDPCGYHGLVVTDLVSLGGPGDIAMVGADLAAQVRRHLETADGQSRARGALA